MQSHKEWLVYAEQDLKAAQILLDSDEVPLGVALFHMQQACEKALKGYLIAKNNSSKKIHDIVILFDQCKVFDKAFEQIESDVVSLNPYYMGTRYPDAAVIWPDLGTARVSLEQTRRVIAFVQDLLH